MYEQIEKPVLITYDLCGPSKNYKDLIDAIQTCDRYYKITESSWIIFSSLTPDLLFDALSKFVDSDDRLVIAVLDGLISGRTELPNVNELNTALDNYLANKE